MDDDDVVVVVRGYELRALLVLVLDEAGRPLEVPGLVAAVRAAGFELAGRPGKAVADALRWEVARGRVRRFGRGTYAGGVVPSTTRRRMRRRVAAAGRARPAA